MRGQRGGRVARGSCPRPQLAQVSRPQERSQKGAGKQAAPKKGGAKKETESESEESSSEESESESE